MLKVLNSNKRNSFFNLIQFFLILMCIPLNVLPNELALTQYNNTTLIDSVKISGRNKYFSDKRLYNDLLNSSIENFRSNKVLLSKENIDIIIDEILQYYTSNGFPFCEIKVINITRKSNNFDKTILNLEINSNDHTLIRFVNFTGNNSSKNDILLRETRLNSIPIKFNPIFFDIARKYLYKTNLFKSIPEYFIVSDKSKKNNYGILFKVEEDKYNSIDAILGYSSKQSNSNNSEFLGKINLSFNNLFGSFRKARLGWYRGIQNDEKIELYYEEPWLLTVPVKTGISFNQNYYDSLYLERSYKLNFDYNLSLNINLISDFELVNIYPDSALFINNIEKHRKEFLSGGFGYTSSYYNKSHINNEDALNLIIKAGTIKNIIKYSNSDITSDHIYYDTNIKFDLNFILNLFKNKNKNMKINNNFLVNKLFFRSQLFYEHIFSNTENLSIYDKLKIGGINSVRGYKDDQFSTISKIYSNNEFIFKLDNDTKLFLLYDIGFWSEKNKIDSPFKDYNLISGLGLGLNYLHRLGEMEVSYAFPIEEGFENGKIHVRYISKF